MSFSLKDSFNKHSKNYSSRVRDRKKYANLELEDKVISDFIKRNWAKKKTSTLIDAGCGTGDRLQMLLATAKLPKQFFSTIIGLDYASGMLELAKKQKLGVQSLYTELHLVDLSKTSINLRGDLVLCLWEIINSAGLKAKDLLKNIAPMVNKDGFLIYDCITLKTKNRLKKLEADIFKANPNLKPHKDKQVVWYQRDDKSIGYLRLFSTVELNKLNLKTDLSLIEVWAYNHRDLIPIEIPVIDGKMNEGLAAKYTGLTLFYKKDN